MSAAPIVPTGAPERRAPSLTRLFAATFIAVAFVGLVNQIITWRNARHTEATMIELTHRLQQLGRRHPSPGLEAQITELQELASDAGDEALQAAAATTVIFVAMVVVLGLGFWYNRRRLAVPFRRVVTALERLTTGNYDERLPENQPAEFGTIARGVNRMAAALAWRERMQDYTARLLTALNTPAGEGGGLSRALDVIGTATGASALVLYQPDYDASEWAPTAVLNAAAHPVSRAVVREVIGDAVEPQYRPPDAAAPALERLRISTEQRADLALAPLRTGDKLVGLLVLLAADPLDRDRRAALDSAVPNLAIACERESAHHRTRRLAAEIRRTAQFLEEQSDELTRVNTELDRASQLKSEFLTNMSHELRTPLNSIIGFSDLLLVEDIGPLTAKQRDFLETVARNGRDLLQLISELLDVSKIEAGRLTLQPEPLALDAVFEEAVASIRAQVEQRHHHLDVQTPTALRIRADRGRVRQVLLNLLSNAVKFTPNGGRITIAARPEDGGLIRVSVSDTGIGITPEDQSKLFQDFVQLDASTSRQYEGTGLGLALSRRLVELHGGAMGVESAPGAGSTFWFTLPAAT
jgi:signal transduction histidine kinase